MTCPSEFVLAQFADGELPEDLAKELTGHLEVCAACRERLASLEIENRLLIQSLQAIDRLEPEWEPIRQKVAGIAKSSALAAAFVIVAILLRAGLGLVLSLEPPPVLDWLNPLSMSGQLTWLANGFFYFVEKGGAMMASVISIASFAILSLVILGCLFAMTRRGMGSTVMIGLMALVFVAAMPGYAMDIRKAEEGRRVITIAPDETVDDTLVVIADSVNVSGTITGDLIAFARQVNIQGAVLGNVIGFGQRVDVEGSVGGDIFGFGQSLQTDGPVGRSFWGFGQNLTVGRGARLEHDATLFGQNANVYGDIGRDLTTFGAFLDVGGGIGRNVRFRGERLTVHAPTKVGGDLNARVRSEKNVQIDPDVIIAGRKDVELDEPRPSKYLTLSFYMIQLIRIGGAFIIGLLLFWLFPSVGKASLSSGRALLTSGGIGFLAAVATPVAALIMLITLVGIPIALVVLLFWLLGLYLAKIIIARCIGDSIFRAKGNGVWSMAIALLIGLVIVIIAVNLPYIGGVLNVLVVLIGLGSLVISLYQIWKRRSKTEPIGNATV